MTWTPFTNWRAGNHELHEHDQPYEKTVITLQFARGHLSAAEHKHWPFKHQKWFTKLFILRPRASQLKHTYVLSDNMIKQCISSAQIYFPENINPYLQIIMQSKYSLAYGRGTVNMPSCMSVHVSIHVILHMRVALMSFISTVELTTQEHFPPEAFELVFTTGPNFFFLLLFSESPHGFAPCSKKAEARIKKTPLLLVSAVGLISPLHRQTERIPRLLQQPGGISQGLLRENLKHLNLFDHNLILKEAMIYSMLAWHPYSDKFSLTHTHPREDWMVGSLQDCISFWLFSKQALISLPAVRKKKKK